MVPWWFYPVSFLIAMLLQVIATIRWRFFLPEKSFAELFKLNLIGIYYSFILPSSVTGDVAKVLQIQEPTKGKTNIVAGLIIDRLIGFLSMTLLLIPAIILSKVAIFYPLLYYVIALAVLLLLTLLSFYFKLASTIFEALTKRLKIKPGKINLLISKCAELTLDIETLMKENKQLIYVFIFASIFQVIFSASFLVTDIIFNFHLSFWHYALFASMMQIIVLLPLSIGGVGLKDVSLVALFSLAGIDSSSALSASLIGYPIFLLIVLIGLYFSFSIKLTKKT
jgi:uncharacterized protein (TIRG00374 family)